MANEMYEYIIEQCKKEISVVEKGIFWRRYGSLVWKMMDHSQLF